MSNKNMLTSFLLPVDDLELFKGTAALAGSMVRLLDGRVERITLLHVLEGSYLAQHMENIDHRVEHVISSDLIRKLKSEYVKKNVEPELERGRELLEQSGIAVPVDIKVRDGSPADVIAEMATTENFSTIVMQRRSLGAIESLLVGSVTERLLHKDITASVYLTGASKESRQCDGASILVALDASEHSSAALEEAAVLLGKCSMINQVVLCSVTDAVSFADAVERGNEPEKETMALLDRAAQRLEASGVPSGKIEKVARYGKKTATALEEEIKNRNINMVFMGRRGRDQVQELFMGSISSKIVSCCPEQTIVLVTGS